MLRPVGVLACLCFFQLMVYREFFMDTMQMVVAIPLGFWEFCTSLNGVLLSLGQISRSVMM